MKESLFMDLQGYKYKKQNPDFTRGFVPKTGFEPARRFQRYHLKVVRLPVSPPGQWGRQNYEKIA
jgi:hypothetical protein